MTNDRPNIVQGPAVDFQLHTLGWKAFQQLIQTITTEIWGQTVQGFLDSHDGGRDGAFHGTWKPTGSEVLTGTFTVQCKHTSKPSKTLKLADLEDELEKAARLAEKGLCDNYILFTNLQLTGQVDTEIRSAFEAIPGVNRFLAFGADRISTFIRESANLRMLVPRIYGLGDLSQILDERAYTQAREILTSMGDLEKFVITNAYTRAAKALQQHGMVMLLGEPACGKSSIAAALSMASLDRWNCSTLKIRTADEFVSHWNPKEPKQFFWVDDIFGATQLELQTTLDWNRALPHLSTAIKKGARFVFTSRDYIYKNAKNFLKESQLPLIRDSQVVINVQHITSEERRQILYNHIKLGNQPVAFKKGIKSYLPGVTELARFTPEIARRLGGSIFTKNFQFTQYYIDNFVNEPVQFLQEIVSNLDIPSRAALALVFMRGGSLSSPVSVTEEEETALSALGGAAVDARLALKPLEGSLLMQAQQAGKFVWKFKHPTIQDAFAGIVAGDREMLDIYLTGTPIDKLLGEIVCGDVKLGGASVVLTAEQYGAVIHRINELRKARSKTEASQRINNFLAYRCSKDFLQQFLSLHPEYMPSLSLWSYLDSITEIGVVQRLHEYGLLPEEQRLYHVATICELATETPDAGILDYDIQKLFKPDELISALDKVRTSLIKELDYNIDQWDDNSHHAETKADYFEPIIATLEEYRDYFKDDETVSKSISAGLAKIKILSDNDDAQPERDYHFKSSPTPNIHSSRSVFDDVDE